MSQPRKRRQTSRKSAGNTGSRLLKGVLITGSVLLVLLFVGLFALKSWIESYRNSEAFRNWLAGKIATSLKSDVELAALKWESGSVYADGFRARGYEDAAHASLEIDGLRANFGGAENGAWQVPEATANRMNLEFSKDRLPGVYKAPASAATGTSSGPEAPGWLKKYLPTEFNIGVIRVDAANLSVLNDSKTETFALRTVPTELKPTAGGGWEIAGRGGKLVITSQPEFAIERFLIRWQGQEVFVNSAEVRVFDNARLSANGVVSLTPGTPIDFDLLVSNLDVKKVLGPDWQPKISGTVSGDIKLEGPVSSLKQTGTLHLAEGLLTNLPVLEKIGQYTKSPRFQRLTLNEARGTFERIGDRIVITDIAVQSDGLSRLEGSLTIEGNAIQGEFQVGVTPGTLRWIPGAERKVFINSNKGFLWTDMIVTGTLDQPKENLSARLVNAAVETVVEEAPEKAIEAAKEALQNPAATPSTVIEEGKKLLNTLSPLLGN
ncbi:MAG: hypothetical protein KDN19_12390 [Verrucomicrobiae bacterium]|nr:hypothetical protein [Verrucomicrobiae bacterium]